MYEFGSHWDRRNQVFLRYLEASHSLISDIILQISRKLNQNDSD